MYCEQFSYIRIFRSKETVVKSTVSHLVKRRIQHKLQKRYYSFTVLVFENNLCNTRVATDCEGCIKRFV